MNDKSHVSLEQHVCLVCGKAFDTGTILLDKRLRASMEHHTKTGWGLCPEHQKLADDGFVALVEWYPTGEPILTGESTGCLCQFAGDAVAGCAVFVGAVVATAAG